MQVGYSNVVFVKLRIGDSSRAAGHELLVAAALAQRQWTTIPHVYCAGASSPLPLDGLMGMAHRGHSGHASMSIVPGTRPSGQPSQVSALHEGFLQLEQQSTASWLLWLLRRCIVDKKVPVELLNEVQQHWCHERGPLIVARLRSNHF